MHKMGYRFRLHRLDLMGNPDIVLPKYTRPSLYFPFFYIVIFGGDVGSLDNHIDIEINLEKSNLFLYSFWKIIKILTKKYVFQHILGNKYIFLQ